jgi:uncharacterized surface protein with fasciclin (FAS1) repeats
MNLSKALILLMLSFPAAACSDSDDGDDNNTAETSVDIVATAQKAGTFKTLVTAVQAADLVATLQGPGPFTVFAPPDSAFSALPAGTVDTLLKPENKAMLTGVLTYHVVAGKLSSSDVAGKASAKTVQGQELMFKTENGKVKVDGATVVTPDIECSNGVIHVIDSVLLPE